MFFHIPDSEPEHFPSVSSSSERRIHDHKTEPDGTVIIGARISYDKMPDDFSSIISRRKRMEPAAFDLRLIGLVYIIPRERIFIKPVS